MQVTLFEKDFKHKHYFGTAKQYEILEKLEGKGQGFFIRVFFINDKVNQNEWQVTWDGIKQDISDVVGVPIVLQDDLRHPDFLIQNLFAKGYIIDYILNEKKHEVSVIARILDPETITLIKSGKLKFTSPSIVARTNLDIETISNVDVLSRFITLHLALVAKPAYGKDDAKITGQCTGTGQSCSGKLRQLTANVLYELDHIGDDISDKISILKAENPTIPHDQIISTAISMSKNMTKLTRKLDASIHRLESEFNMLTRQASRSEFGNKWGYWIKARDVDVFVADDDTVDKAISKQCGCPAFH